MDRLLYDRALGLLARLDQHEVDYVLVGGLALACHELVRATQDIDLFVRPTADNVERLRSALRQSWADPDIEEIRWEDLAGDYPAIRYGPPGEPFTIDLLARLGEAFRFEDLEAETKTVEGVPVRVATPRTLYRMKKDTVRPQDRLDAAALLQRFGGLEEEG